MADEPNIDITEPTDRWLWVCDVAAEMTDRGLSTSGLEVDTLVAIPHEGTATFRPLTTVLTERATPELVYLQTKFAGLVSYGVTADLLGEILPVGRTIHATEIRRSVHRVAKRLDDRLEPEQAACVDEVASDRDGSAHSDPAMLVGIDGGYVRSAAPTSKRGGSFEVIAGKTVPVDGSGTSCFAYVQTYDTNPQQRIREQLRARGIRSDDRVVFLTDGGADVRDLPATAHSNIEQHLDWFHITMRITVLCQTARGLSSDDLLMAVLEDLDRVKWQL